MGSYLEHLQQQSRKWESAYRQLTVLYRIAYHLQGSEPVEEKLEKVARRDEACDPAPLSNPTVGSGGTDGQAG